MDPRQDLQIDIVFLLLHLDHVKSTVCRHALSHLHIPTDFEVDIGLWCKGARGTMGTLLSGCLRCNARTRAHTPTSLLNATD